MANLETLELTINANAESASQGINTLIRSLASLSDALIKPYSDLRDFNDELKRMRDLSKGVKFSSVGKAASAAKQTAKAIVETEEEREKKLEHGRQVTKEWLEKTRH